MAVWGKCPPCVGSPSKHLPHINGHPTRSSASKWLPQANTATGGTPLTNGHLSQMAAVCTPISAYGLAAHRVAGDAESSQCKRDKFSFDISKAGLGVLQWGSWAQRTAVSRLLQGHNEPRPPLGSLPRVQSLHSCFVHWGSSGAKRRQGSSCTGSPSHCQIRAQNILLPSS